MGSGPARSRRGQSRALPGDTRKGGQKSIALTRPTVFPDRRPTGRNNSPARKIRCTKSPVNMHQDHRINPAAMKSTQPFLISIPHGGTEVPEEVRPRLALTDDELRYHCDPDTRDIFRYGDRVAAFIDTPVSRMVVDLNRPPLPLPPKDPDGIIKLRTVDGKEVYRPGCLPGITLIHQLLKAHYFPYHQSVDELIDRCGVEIAFDCHSMLPNGSTGQRDAGKSRPLICLGNNGDLLGNPPPEGIATCPAEWIATLARGFEEEFAIPGMVALNDPFPGGFIANSHFWHKGVPWIQIEVNRLLYERDAAPGSRIPVDVMEVPELRERIWRVLARFWQEI